MSEVLTSESLMNTRKLTAGKSRLPETIFLSACGSPVFFANCYGGVMILGVKELYESVKVDREKQTSSWEEQMTERFFFERPSSARKADITEYLNEFVAVGSEINGSGSLDRMLSGWTFEQALDRCLKMENKEYAEKVGRCPGKTFLLIRENDNRLVGTVNVR